MAELEKQEKVVINGGNKEEEMLLDFNLLYSTVALQTQGKLRKLESAEDPLKQGNGEFGEIVIALESASCPLYRFGMNVRQAGLGFYILQGTVCFILAVTAILNFLAFIVTKRNCFLYLSVAFIMSVGAYLGFFRSQIKRRFNIRGYDSLLDDWSPRGYTSPGEDSCITTFKPINQDFSSEHQRLNSVTSSDNNTSTCQFQISSVSCAYPSTLLQTMFEPDPQPQSQQQSILDNNRSFNYMSATANYGAMNTNELSSSWTKLAPVERPSLPKKLPSSLHFTNNASFWNASATGINNVKAGFLPSQLQSELSLQTFEEKPNCPSLTEKSNTEEIRNLGSAMKKGTSSERPLLEGPRIDTPSSLPTFKKEKLGDRITALHQLVSPFGKTDTASVLAEAIGYIKFLHDQADALSTPYMKQAAASIQQRQQQGTESLKDPEVPKQDLRSRGLCLVPISSTFPIAF